MSCEYRDPIGPYPNSINEKSYIQGFLELNWMHGSPTSGIKVNKTENSINLRYRNFDESKIYDIKDGVGISLTIGKERSPEEITWDNNIEHYNELTKKIGDISYNSRIMSGVIHSDRIIAIADTLQSVNIICDKSIDENHPAGSNLNDIFSVYFEDPYAVIKNGYQSVTGSNYYSLDRETIPEGFPYALFGSKLSAIDFSVKPYIGTEWYLVLETAPENTDEYTFTISITDMQGKTIEKKARAPIKIKGSKG